MPRPVEAWVDVLGDSSQLPDVSDAEEGAPVSGIGHGVGITGTRFRWTDGVIPWEFHPNFPQSRRQTILNAIRHWEQNTFLRFPQRTSQNDRVRFISADGCWSQVGQRNGLSAGDIAAVRAMYPAVGPIQPAGVATPQEIRLRDGNGRDVVVVSGYAVFNFRGRGGELASPRHPYSCRPEMASFGRC